MSSRVSVPRGPASRRLPPRQLPPRPRPTRGGPPVPDVPCPGRCNNLVLTLFTQYNRVVPSSIGRVDMRVDYIRYLTFETTERSCARSRTTTRSTSSQLTRHTAQPRRSGRRGAQADTRHRSQTYTTVSQRHLPNMYRNASDIITRFQHVRPPLMALRGAGRLHTTSLFSCIRHIGAPTSSSMPSIVVKDL
jgi:hypothetical protein